MEDSGDGCIDVADARALHLIPLTVWFHADEMLAKEYVKWDAGKKAYVPDHVVRQPTLVALTHGSTSLHAMLPRSAAGPGIVGTRGIIPAVASQERHPSTGGGAAAHGQRGGRAVSAADRKSTGEA
jgi:hypothetical protein